MRKILLLLIVFVTPLMANQFKIGYTNWYTEDIEFSKLLHIAKKQNKAVLTVFSATWCNPCQIMKKELFSKKEFKKVEDKYLLQYIEQTTPKGDKYVKQFDITVFPSIKLFNSDGFEISKTIKGNQPGIFNKLLALDLNKKQGKPADELSRCNILKMYKQTIQLSERYLKDKKVKLSDKKFFLELVKAYINIDRIDKALFWRNKVREHILKDKLYVVDNSYLKMNRIIIEKYFKSNKKKIAEEISRELISDIQGSKNTSNMLGRYLRASISIGLHFEYLEEILNKLIKNANSFNAIPFRILKARIFIKTGEIEKAKKIFRDIVEDKDSQNVFIVGPVVEAMIELKIINTTTLRAAEIIIKYYKAPMTFSLHAEVCEGLKDYKGAIASLEKAMALEKDKEKLKKLKKEIMVLKQKI